MYELDDCSTNASAGFDVVALIDNDLSRLHRLGTYSSQRVAKMTAEELGSNVHVIQRF